MAADGHATFDLIDERLVAACGEAWRYLVDLVEDEDGRPAAIPWETYGPLPTPQAPPKTAA